MADHRILIRGVNWLGDAIMTTPALLRLREAQPEARISLLSPAKLAALWEHHPALDQVIAVSPGESLWKVTRRLRAHTFQTGLIFPNSIRSALELWLGGVPNRIGYARPGRNWCLTESVPDPPGTIRMRKRSPREVRKLLRQKVPVVPAGTPWRAHQMHHYLGLAARLGGRLEPVAPGVAVLDEELREVSWKFGLGHLSRPLPLVGLNPGAEYGPAKRWPEELFAEAASRIDHHSSCAWILTGGPGDAPLCARLAERLAKLGRNPGDPSPVVIDLSGKTSLRELCAVLKLCRAVVTNDSGPMHLAAAVGTPVIALFGSTSPELTSPGLLGGRQVILRSPTPCAPCFQRTCPVDLRCLRDIPVQRVVEAVLAVLAAPDHTPRF